MYTASSGAALRRCPTSTRSSTASRFRRRRRSTPAARPPRTSAWPSSRSWRNGRRRRSAASAPAASPRTSRSPNAASRACTRSARPIAIPVAAARIANVYATQYLLFSKQSARSQIAAAIAVIDRQLADCPRRRRQGPSGQAARGPDRPADDGQLPGERQRRAGRRRRRPRRALVPRTTRRPPNTAAMRRPADRPPARLLDRPQGSADPRRVIGRGRLRRAAPGDGVRQAGGDIGRGPDRSLRRRPPMRSTCSERRCATSTSIVTSIP